MAERCFGCMQMKQMHPVCEYCGYDERTQNSDHQLPTGTVLGGQYLIGKALGQGGFGITYLAWDQVMNQPVAVKEYFPKGFASRTVGNTKVTSYDGQNAHDFEFNKKRFLREAESLAKLWNIPQIVKILRYFEENGTAYIVMEYVQGVDLRKHLKKLSRPLTVEETLALMGPVAEGLDLVHKIDLVHRDISPDNIMVLPDGSTKLLDFGAARFVENANADQERLTSTQAVLKHGFAPPEQYRTHGALGPWTDVYALCATIYYCLSGKVPTEAMARTVDEESIDWNVIHGLSEKQKAALEKGMAIQAKNRFATVQELWAQLKPEQGGPKPEEPGKGPLWKRKGILTLAAALVTAVLGAALFLGGGGEPEPALPAETTEVPVMVSAERNSPITYIFEENETGWTITGYEGDKNNLPEIVILPGEKDGEPVTAIASYAFLGCSRLTGVTIPDSVTAIGDATFYGCGLTSLTIPESVTSIGESAFYSCSSLTEVTIPNGVTHIGDSAFMWCRGLTEVSIPECMTAIGNSVFSGCSSLTGVTIPESVTSIGNSAFSYCSSLAGVTIPESVTSIGESAFYSCSSLTEVTIPNGVTHIGDSAFMGCRGLTEVSIPECTAAIGNSVFSGCSSLSSVMIPDSVTSIGISAFSFCSSLSSVTIPDSVTSIVCYAFQGCSGMTSATVPKDCEIGYEAFPDTCKVNRR